MKKWLSVITAGIVGTLLPLPGKADTLIMKDGTQQVGIVTQELPDRVTIRTINGELSIPRAKITRVAKQTPAESYLALGDKFLSTGQASQALENYKRAQELNAAVAGITEKIAQAEQGLVAVAQQAQVTADVRTEKTIQKAMTVAASRSYDEAFQLLQSVEVSAESSLYPVWRKAMTDLHYAWGLDRLDRADSGGAAEKFNVVLRLDPDNVAAREQMVRTFEGDPTKLKETAEFYGKSDKPEDQIKAADAHFKLREFDKALVIYLKYYDDPKFGTDIVKERSRTILDTLHQQFASRGDYEAALETYLQYASLQPAADGTTAFKYEYMIQRNKTDMNNADQRVALATYAEERGLLDTAREEYTNVLQMAPDNAGATAGLMRFAQADLASAEDFYTQAAYPLAIQKARDVATNYARFPAVLQAAQQLVNRAQLEQDKAVKSMQEEAVALALRGDEYYNRALTYLSAYIGTETRTNTFLFSPRNEAANYLSQAIYAWRTALQMDPTLGGQASYNLVFKIQDASAKLATAGNRVAPPIRQFNRSQTQDN